MTTATADTTATESMLAKIRGLLAKAESHAATEHEAAAYTAKAEALIHKYAVDTALLAAQTHDPTDKPDQRTIIIPKLYGRAKMGLLSVVAEHLGCRTVWVKGRGDAEYRIIAVGFESDLNLVELLYTSLLSQAHNAMVTDSDRAKQLHGWSGIEGSSMVRSYRVAFMTAYAGRISTRLEQIRAARDPQEPGTELVLANRDEQVQDAFAKAFPRVGSASANKIRNAAGMLDGARAASRADLGQGKVAR